MAPTAQPKGMSLLEVMIAMSVLAVGIMAGMSAQMSITELTLANQEDLLAINIARQKLAELKDAPFSSLFSSYGPNSGAQTVDVSSLQSGALPGGTVTITFPVDNAGKLNETVIDSAMGMRMDLNGDGATNSSDVSGSYKVLPLRITVQWNSRTGTRQLSLNTLLTKLN